MSLTAEIVVALPALALDARFEMADEIVALVGPNGAGKTSVLRALAGLTPLDTGHIVLDGVALDDPAAGSWVSPDARSIGLVFQDYLLFPHLSVLDNVAFGLRARGMRRAEADRRARTWLERVGIAQHEHARPSALSGGQAQLVALARALAPEPRLVLLDEPLAALDATTRVDLRRELRRHLDSRSGPRLVVTHDPLEAMALADRLVVLEAGRVVQQGDAREIRARPRSRYVADFVGVNLFRGHARGDRVVLPGGAVLVTPGAGEGEVFAVVHPRSVALHRSRPDGTPRNVWECRVEHVDDEGDRLRVSLSGPVPLVAEITPAAARELGIAVGCTVWAALKATEITVSAA